MKQIKILIIAVILTGFCSCRKNLLTVQPTNLVTFDQAMSDVAGLTAYVAGMYVDCPIQDFSFNHGLFWTFPGNNSNQYIANKTDESGIINTDNNQVVIDSRNYQVLYRSIRNVNMFIKLLTATTNFDSTPEVKPKFLAEAAFLRAYYYFGLVQWYGGVPILLAPQDTPLAVAPSTEVQVWDQVKSDLEKAEAGLPDDYGYGRASKWVAYALEARAMLHAGSVGIFGDPAVLTLTNNLNGVDATNATKYMQAAFDCSAAVIGSGKYSLYTKYANPGQADATNRGKFATNFQYLFYDVKPGDSNTEAILCRGYDYAVATDHRTHSEDLTVLPYYIRSAVAGYYNALQPSLDLVEKFEYYDQPASAGSLAAPAGAFGKDNIGANALGQLNVDYHFPAITTPFDKKDPRYHGTIVSNGTFFRTAVITGFKGVILAGAKYQSPSGIAGYSNYFDLTSKVFGADPSKFTALGHPYVLGSGNSDNDIRPFWKKKFVDPVTDISLIRDYTSRTSWCDIRYGEILLTYAEASFELAQLGVGIHPATEALNAINLLRARAGMPLYGAVGRNEIRHERLIELAYENKTYWDYIRWRSFATDFTNRQEYGLQCWWDQDNANWVYRRVTNGNQRTLAKQFYYSDFATGDITTNPALRPTGHNPYY